MNVSATPIGLLLAVLAVTACAGISADFVKEGAATEEIRADNGACRAETEARVGRESDITHDIRVGGSRASADATRLLQVTRDSGVERRYDRIFTACMKARGYSQLKK
ncbi:MAG: hypothetical protein E2O36_05480 [Proteobacteria bacterium]|nr:MAG: hypothetical protein E2O36_05480 [Pseudomonadota bacterium]